MCILLATGIYPPAIGGIATYAENLAEGLSGMGHEVRVMTYGEMENAPSIAKAMEGKKWTMENDMREAAHFDVVRVSNSGGMFARWRQYAKALKEYGQDADAVIALSSVSVGIPLMMAGLKKQKKILRLGGEFFWERYTDGGGMMSLREWHATRFGFWRIMNAAFMEAILGSFDRLVYSTEFQKNLHEKFYAGLPEKVVIENAASTSPTPSPSPEGRGGRRPHVPFRIVFMGRFVGFKNVLALVDAMRELPDVSLTIVGEGPMQSAIDARIASAGVGDRVTVRPSVSGEEKGNVFDEHDLLVLPSVTEISPNVALEAVSAGLPVLLTEETGYRASASILLRPLRTPAQIAAAVREVKARYPALRSDVSVRHWQNVVQEWDFLLRSR